MGGWAGWREGWEAGALWELDRLGGDSRSIFTAEDLEGKGWLEDEEEQGGEGWCWEPFLPVLVRRGEAWVNWSRGRGTGQRPVVDT